MIGKIGLYVGSCSLRIYTAGLLYSCLQVGHSQGVFSSGFEFSLSKFLLLHQFAMTLSKYWRIKAYRSTHLIIWGDDPSVLLKFPPMDADSEN